MTASEPSPVIVPAPDRHGGRRRRTRWFVALAAVPLVALAGGAAWLHFSGTPLMDEWVCADGEVPVTHREGGSSCIPEGADPGAGETLDPFGNRPLHCHERWGWTEVYPLAVDAADPVHVTTDCVRNGESIPEGWKAVPEGWKPSDGRPLSTGRGR